LFTENQHYRRYITALRAHKKQITTAKIKIEFSNRLDIEMNMDSGSRRATGLCQISNSRAQGRGGNV